MKVLILTDAQKREIKSLREIANNIAGYDLFSLFAVFPSQHVGKPYHWCLKRIDQIRDVPAEPSGPMIRFLGSYDEK